ncbi:MAG: phasin family protein [Parvibaculum sp.]
MATTTRKTKKSTKAAKAAKAEVKLPLARDIWLAGLGFYGRLFDETSARVGGARAEANKLFDELVDRGAAVEKDTRKALKDVRFDTNGSVEERIKKLRDSLPELPKFPEMPELGQFSQITPFKSARVRELEAEIEALTKKVNALSRAAKAKPVARKTPARKAA